MDDIEVDDLINIKARKKKINSGNKGKRVERDLCKLLNERFHRPFSRSVGSGNRWSQANLPSHAQQVFSGDLVCPENFLWVIEVKGGYDDIDLNSALEGGNAQIDQFLKQAAEESDRTGRKSMLLWKKDRKPWIVFLRTTDLPHEKWVYRLVYREWSAVALSDLLKLDDGFFMN